MQTSVKTDYQQHGSGWMRYPAGGWLRWFYRAPLLQYRLGLGWLLRPMRCLVLTTKGRSSGRPRHTVLEHSVLDGLAYVAPGWGKRTQWYLNILAHPYVTVQRNGHTYCATARVVTDEHERARLYDVAHGRSPVWKQYLKSWGVEDTREDYARHADRLIVLRLDPVSAPPLPALCADLAWVWPAAVLGGLALYLAFHSRR